MFREPNNIKNAFRRRLYLPHLSVGPLGTGGRIRTDGILH